jgi:hypothetical protein
MKKNSITLVIAAFCFLQSCNKKDAPDSHYGIDGDLKTAFSYLPGTYWIYRDSITGRIDSFAVKSNTFSTSIVSNYSIDGIDMQMTEYNAGSFTDTSGWDIILATNYEELIWYSNHNFLGQEYLDLDPAFTYPFSSAAPSIFGGNLGSDNAVSVISVLPTFSLLGNAYNNVQITSHSATFNNIPGYDDRLFVSADIGIIKMCIHDYYDTINKVWELQRYKIVK